MTELFSLSVSRIANGYQVTVSSDLLEDESEYESWSFKSKPQALNFVKEFIAGMGALEAGSVARQIENSREEE